ncbi:hypothetical protein [Bailinhaonella thermotolerans]|uniref:Uncharacterized protein n=1 Tax=Bailinhaonella thermotolerans TaxID=1070861 RepID=A0A3A4ARP7_9ACTN|nr:hypothetical protein [Bailinhaonella thermotolerans]RJL31811.1 hypothetical protein D5H75_19160 [Bailinhaonella thermotolerans]
MSSEPVRFEWEVFYSHQGEQKLGPCGVNVFQATAMDQLRTALRRFPPDAEAWGRICKRVYDHNAFPPECSRYEVWRAELDAAGSVRWQIVQKTTDQEVAASGRTRGNGNGDE